MIEVLCTQREQPSEKLHTEIGTLGNGEGLRDPGDTRIDLDAGEEPQGVDLDRAQFEPAAKPFKRDNPNVERRLRDALFDSRAQRCCRSAALCLERSSRV